jgi:hypothetical protein
MSKRAFRIALFLGGMAFLAPTAARSQALGGSGQRLEGTWILTGTVGPVTLKSIPTYLADGAAFGANSNTFQALQGGAPQTQTFNNPAQGSGSEPAIANSPVSSSTLFSIPRARSARFPGFASKSWSTRPGIPQPEPRRSKLWISTAASYSPRTRRSI